MESRSDDTQKELIPEPKSGLMPINPIDLEIVAGYESINGNPESDSYDVKNDTRKRQTIFPFVRMIRVAVRIISVEDRITA
jgi:hypothetical protein